MTAIARSTAPVLQIAWQTYSRQLSHADLLCGVRLGRVEHASPHGEVQGPRCEAQHRRRRADVLEAVLRDDQPRGEERRL